MTDATRPYPIWYGHQIEDGIDQLLAFYWEAGNLHTSNFNGYHDQDQGIKLWIHDNDGCHSLPKSHYLHFDPWDVVDEKKYGKTYCMRFNTFIVPMNSENWILQFKVYGFPLNEDKSKFCFFLAEGNHIKIYGHGNTLGRLIFFLKINGWTNAKPSKTRANLLKS